MIGILLVVVVIIIAIKLADYGVSDESEESCYACSQQESTRST
jgi:hypothetical protein